MSNNTKDKDMEKTYAVGACALLILQLDDACPDVGMGMWPWMAVDEAITKLNYDPNCIDKQAALNFISSQRNKRKL